MTYSLTFSNGIDDPDRQIRVARLARSTGSAWVAGGAIWLVAGLVHGVDGWRFGVSSILWLLADVLIAAGILGLVTLRPHGASRLGAIALFVAFVARVAFAAGEVTSLIQGHDDNPFIPVGALLTALSMTVYGTVVARRRELHGVSRWAFLTMGLYPVVTMFPALAATGEPSSILIALWGLPAALVGAACTPSGTSR